MVSVEKSNVSIDGKNKAKEPEARYFFLKERDFDEVQRNLGFDPQQVTADTYGAYVDEYSEIEWGSKLVKLIWERYGEVFKELIQDVQPGPDGKVNVLVGGDGTGRDLIFLLLLNEHAWLRGYDIVPEMVRVGQEIISSEKIGLIIETLESGEDLKGIVGKYGVASEILEEVMETLRKYSVAAKNFLDITTEKSPEDEEKGEKVPANSSVLIDLILKGVSEEKSIFFKSVVELIQRRITMEVADHRKLTEMTDEKGERKYKNNSVDLILQNATYQHLSKKERRRAIAEHLLLLRDNGQMYWNHRVSESGRVFCDNRLNPKAVEWTDLGMRYYTTDTHKEIDQLEDDIESGALFEEFGLKVPEGVLFRREGKVIHTPAANDGSPDFRACRMRRLYQPQQVAA